VRAVVRRVCDGPAMITDVLRTLRTDSFRGIQEGIVASEATGQDVTVLMRPAQGRACACSCPRSALRAPPSSSLHFSRQWRTSHVGCVLAASSARQPVVAALAVAAPDLPDHHDVDQLVGDSGQHSQHSLEA
jgi:hypothetical protein